ncbi:acylglycerol kinase family protein [Sphingomonas sp.]|uniref:acylglycerol kinase family protein n=1 Tax=Sphingomonas sp. TaxID=28214 RepID=UPI002DD6508D|nr:acylglycerol kinase family protein [Sphingomonas sp.]
MKNSIYDILALPRLAWEPAGGGGTSSLIALRPFALGRAAPGLIGLIRNPRARHNLGTDACVARRDNVLAAAPANRAELRDVLASFAARGIDLLVIDGGDGTIRDVLTCAGDAWGSAWPRIAILPSGKTNALAVDLGVPAGWTFDDAIKAATDGRIVKRAPLEVGPRGGGLAVRGFLFGGGGFVAATELAQHTHKAGAFNGLAVGLALAGAIGSTLFGGADNRWRRGSRIALRYTDGVSAMHGAAIHSDGNRYVMLASTLERFPMGLKPFGTPRPGMKTLVVDAPPRLLAWSAPGVLTGSEAPAYEARGYHRIDAQAVEIDLEAGFILDGEMFPGGAYTLRRAAPLRFVAP